MSSAFPRNEFVIRYMSNNDVQVLQPILYSVPLIPANNRLFKVNNIYTSNRFEICSKLTIKTVERR